MFVASFVHAICMDTIFNKCSLHLQICLASLHVSLISLQNPSKMTLTKEKEPLHVFPGKGLSNSVAVLFWLLASLVVFYAVFFIVASLVHGIFRLDNFDGTIPFHYESYQDIFSNSTKWDMQPFLGDFIALECTYFSSAFLFLTFLRQRFWDFALTVTIIHCAITCAVNVSFPLVWEWWICILIGLAINISLGQLINKILSLKKRASFKLIKPGSDALS